MAELIIRSGKHQGKKLIINDPEIMVGRDEACKIRIASNEVSRRHCVILNSSSGLVIRDLKSGNGTYVNDTLIEQETALKPGDTIRVGPLELQVPGVRKEPKKKSQPETSIFSEEDIANWLSDDEEHSGGSPGGGTTIIRHDRLPPVAPPAAPRKQYRSIAEEAADIIRKHWETVGKDDE